MSLRYVTDPQTARSTGKPTLPGSIIDVPRTMAAHAAGKIDGPSVQLPPPYNDERLIAIVIALGMPRWSAEQMRYHPGLRLNYFSLCLDVEAAARGDKPAQARVDAVRARFVDERKAERIADIPNQASGYIAQ